MLRMLRLLVENVVTDFGNRYLNSCFLLHVPRWLLWHLLPMQPESHQASHLRGNGTACRAAWGTFQKRGCVCKCKSRPPGAQGWRGWARDLELLVTPGAVPRQLQAPPATHFPSSLECAFCPLFPREGPLQRRPPALRRPPGQSM